MAKTRKSSAAVGAATGAAGSKSGGRKSGAPAATKRKADATTVSSPVAASSPIVAVTANAASKPNTAVTDPSPPRRGKRQKDGSPPPKSPATSKSPAITTSPATATKKSPLKIKYCCWTHCPYPHLGFLIKTCSMEGCVLTMHEQCLFEFENEVRYERDHNGDDDEPKYYCPNHHPRREELLSEDDDGDEEGVIPSLPPPLPPLPAADTECDWRTSTTGCKLSSIPTTKCQHEGCIRQVHHLCSIEWESSVGTEESTISSYCRYHHPIYPTMNQLQTVPTTAVNNPPSPSLTNNEDEHQNDDESTKEVIMGGKESGNSDDDNDSSICSGDSGCSGDDGSEAEIHDAGTEFEPMENTIDDMYGVDFVQGLPGSPDSWSPPGPPDGWVYNPPDGSPKEEDIDNPANWNLYSFSPKINASTKKYEGHFTPAGAKVVPTTPDGSREIGGWTFHYNGWKADEFDKATFVRDDASHGNLKPESRKGRLDVDILKKHGLNATRMKDDPLFFYQMLFPIADPKHSTIDGDGRMPYFSMASVCTNVYAAASGAGSGVGHDWVGVTAPELVKWTACPIRNGALDGKPATLTARWKRDDPRYDSYTAENISQTRFKMIKRFFKLNNNLMDAKKGDAGYNPCSKYDFIYKVLIHNMNYVTQFADLDATIDESTWGFGGFSGECGGRLINKPVSRGKYKMAFIGFSLIVSLILSLPRQYIIPVITYAGGQIAMLFDINHRYPRAYVHRHKLHPRHPPFKAVGQSEVVMLVGMIDLLLKDQAADADEPKIAIQNPTSATRLEYTLKPLVHQSSTHNRRQLLFE